MAQTYAQIQKQIEQLQRQAAAIRNEEIKGVVDRIKVAIAHYGLTAQQLGLGTVASTPASRPVSRIKGKVRFSDQAGHSWTGRGPRPAWLRHALEAGHHINEFKVGRRGKPIKTPAVVASSVASSPAATSAPVPPKQKSPTVRYTDGAGNSWSGMGPKPGWLKKGIESGKTLADFGK